MAALASPARGYEADAYAGAAGGVCGVFARVFLADAWPLGKLGHTHIPGGGERGILRCTPTAWKLRIDKNAETKPKNPMVADASEYHRKPESTL